MNRIFIKAPGPFTVDIKKIHILSKLDLEKIKNDKKVLVMALILSFSKTHNEFLAIDTNYMYQLFLKKNNSNSFNEYKELKKEFEKYEKAKKLTFGFSLKKKKPEVNKDHIWSLLFFYNFDDISFVNSIYELINENYVQIIEHNNKKYFSPTEKLVKNFC